MNFKIANKPAETTAKPVATEIGLDKIASLQAPALAECLVLTILL